MNIKKLSDTAQQMVMPSKGLLAMDESTPTCGKRFAEHNIENTEGNRRDYRKMLLTTPGLPDYVSGAILYDETIRMHDAGGNSFIDLMHEAGVMPGIKVDIGARDLAGHPGEKVTEGLDGLRDRLGEYVVMGAKFAKWRAVITIGDGIPSRGCVHANSHALARYAALCQEAGLVPIVEPEVMLAGDHDIERCSQVTTQTLTALFDQLRIQRVALEGTILKASMVLPGKDCPERASIEEVARATLRCLYNCVPPALPGVAFLSGGQTPEEASAHLNMINAIDEGRAPWALTFSYARALQEPALSIWKGDNANAGKAQAVLLHRAKCNSDAARAGYDPKMDRNAA